MNTLGDLERSIMETLWNSVEPLSATELQSRLSAVGTGRELAQTTILTVLSRLEKKGFVASLRDRRPRLFRANRSREDHTADLMLEVLGGAGDRDAALARFVDTVSSREADTLRRLLG